MLVCCKIQHGKSQKSSASQSSLHFFVCFSAIFSFLFCNTSSVPENYSRSAQILKTEPFPVLFSQVLQLHFQSRNSGVKGGGRMNCENPSLLNSILFMSPHSLSVYRKQLVAPLHLTCTFENRQNYFWMLKVPNHLSIKLTL